MDTRATDPLPERFDRVAGPLPPAGALDPDRPYPFATIEPAQQGFVDRDGVKIWYAVWGTKGPWIAFPPPIQFVHTALFKATVPYLAEHFRVITSDNRGNGRSDRPRGQQHYHYDLYHGDFVAVLDAIGVERLALVGLSMGSMLALRLAAEQPQRITHLITSGGFADTLLSEEQMARMHGKDMDMFRHHWPTVLDNFVASIFTEPHSTKPFEDAVHYGWATDGEVVGWARNGWFGHDARDFARQVKCPTLVIHGDADARIAYERGKAVADLVPGASMITVGGGGHVQPARDPVMFNRAVRDFIGTGPKHTTWTRGMSRPRRALFICSPIGLGQGLHRPQAAAGPRHCEGETGGALQGPSGGHGAPCRYCRSVRQGAVLVPSVRSYEGLSLHGPAGCQRSKGFGGRARLRSREGPQGGTVEHVGQGAAVLMGAS